MKTFIITLKSFQPAIDTAEVCCDSCLKFGFEPEIFWGVEGSDAATVIEDLGIKMSTNHADRVIQKAHRPGQQGCFLSHYFLWKECIKRNEPIVILENDTIIIRPFPDVAWKGVLQLNPQRYDDLDPNELNAPDTVRDHVHEFLGYKGMNGTQALAIKPDAAQKFVDATHEDGFLPVDGFMKPEIAPLEELSPRVAIINKDFCYSLTRDYEQLTGLAPGGPPPGPPGGMRLTAAEAAGGAGMDPEKPETWGKLSRNQPCPCGSGKKYKHCHGAIATGNRVAGAQ